MAEQDVDVVFHLGDYLYEYGIPPNGGYREEGGVIPSHLHDETITLDQYRDRYALYKADADLQAAHAAFPWITTLDDHEVEDNWADEISQDRAPRDEFLVRRANALRAFWEHMPLRRLQEPTGWDMKLYRRFTFGDLAEFSLLDTRQYRSDQAAGDGLKPPNPEAQDPARTITGDEQERWLLDGLGSSRARWNGIAQQVAMTQIDIQAGEGQVVPMDTWDGYTASRDRTFSGILERGVSNVVVITGDLHRSVAADLKLDFDDPDSPTVGAEFVGTSITSGRDGVDHDQTGLVILAENPHIRYHNFQRGYVRCRITPDEWRSDYRVVEYVTSPGAPAFTKASLVVENGRPGIQSA
jgi:phosphodiesterase/alkaline phosphatase D-like protein